MKKTVVMTVGAPGSGKSTWAKREVSNNIQKCKTIVLCRDDLRSMLFGEKYKYSRSNESLVLKTMNHMLSGALCDDTTQRIIIADTNLNESTRKGFESIVRDCKSIRDDVATSIEYQTFDEPWHVLVSRNEKRGEKAVPITVLRTMYKNMQIYLGKHKEYVPDLSKPKAVIFDLDGTLADNTSRHPFDFDKLNTDKPIDFVVNLAKMYEATGHEIICVSGRNAGTKEEPRKWHTMTKCWLDDNEIPWYTLKMRKEGDFRKDDIVKEEIFWNEIADKYNVVATVDDRQQVVEMWRRIGLNCLQVNFGDF